MNLTKDQKQKMALTGLLLCAFLYFFFNTLLGGLAKNARRDEARIKEVTPLVEKAEKEVNASKQLEAQMPAANDKMAEVKSRIPQGSPLAWYPPKLAEFFRRHKIVISTPRVVRDQVDFGVPGLVRMYWSVEIPEVDAVSLGISIAGLENEDPLTRVDSIQISADSKNAEVQHATLTLATIVRK